MNLYRLTDEELLRYASNVEHDLTTTPIEKELAARLQAVLDDRAGTAPLIKMLDDHSITEPVELEPLLTRAARVQELIDGHDGLLDLDDVEAALQAVDGYTPKALIETLAFADSVKRLLETYEITDADALEDTLQSWATARQSAIPT